MGSNGTTARAAEVSRNHAESWLAMGGDSFDAASLDHGLFGDILLL